MQNKLRDLRLIPYRFKKYEYGLMIFLILMLILSVINILPVEKELTKIVIKDGFLIALLLLTLTEERIEDELIIRIRLKSFAAAFIAGVVSVIAEPFINLAFDGIFFMNKGTGILLVNMFMFYFIFFYLMKNNR